MYVLSFIDVNIWLVTFGFHLHNVIPGFPIPKFDLTQPSLEMRKSQLWDDLPVCHLMPFFLLKNQMNMFDFIHPT